MTTHNESILSVKLSQRSRATIEAALEAQAGATATMSRYLVAVVATVVTAVSWIAGVSIVALLVVGGVARIARPDAVSFQDIAFGVGGIIAAGAVAALWLGVWTMATLNAWNIIRSIRRKAGPTVA